jgi:hypothetical protein
MNHKSIISVAAAVMLCPAVAAADSPKLKGSYAFSGMATCLFSGQPFTTGGGSLHPQPWAGWSPNGAGPGQGGFALTGMAFGNGIFTSNFSVEGIRTFNGDGTGTVVGTSVDVVGPPALTPRVSVETFKGNFNYTVDANGGFDIQPGTIVSTSVPQDSSPVQHVSTSKISLFGMTGTNNSVLTLASVAALQETQTALDFAFVPGTVTGAGDITTRYRICARARGLVSEGNGK